MEKTTKQKNLSNDFELFSSEYHKKEKEILILTKDQSGGACKINDSWDASQYFLAYVDLGTNELKKGDGRINWLLTEEECNEFGTTYPYYFKNGTIYHLKVRELIDKTVPEGRLPAYYNRFMVVEVLNEDVKNEELLAILADYRKPVNITDEKLGEFGLNKDYDCSYGKVSWMGSKIPVTLEVDTEDKATWTEALEILRTLSDEQKKYDQEFRAFAAEQLTGLANDWLEDENKEITKSDFIKRISLSELVIDCDGDYTAYYNDDDMFYGHIIDLYGNIKTGMSSANIAG